MTSQIHLEAIWRFRQNKLSQEITEHTQRWNEKKKCSCMHNKPFPDELYVCAHLQKDREKKFGEKIKKQFKDAYFISSVSLAPITKPKLNF